MNSREIRISLALAGAVALSFLANYLILSRAHEVNLKADPIAYQIGKALQGGADNYRPLENIDYTVSNKRFFGASNDWVVVTITPLNNSLNTESLVLKKTSGNFNVVYGPSNFFQGNGFESLPSDIKNYLVGQ